MADISTSLSELWLGFLAIFLVRSVGGLLESEVLVGVKRVQTSKVDSKPRHAAQPVLEVEYGQCSRSFPN